MPNPKANLDLDAWSNFLPKERTNDYEYNLLLYKFKSFFNEVKDFKELHSNCLVARAATGSTADPPLFGSSPIHTSLTGSSPPQVISINSKSNSKNPTNGQQVLGGSIKKPYLQHQNTVPTNGNGPNSIRDSIFKRNQFCQQSSASTHSKDEGSSTQHYNSSYNLNSSANLISNHNNLVDFNKPEIRQRNQVPNSRFLISKSSERLDSINNNLSLASSLKNSDLEAYHSKSFTPPVARDAKYLQNDSNIYDAVSPDDVLSSDLPANKVAASIQNLNRLSLPQKSKLESAKSSAGVETSKVSAARAALESKSVPNDNHDQKSSNSFGSSTILDNTNHSNSSLSVLTNKENNDFANYVNIDFFLKRSNSPSFDGLDEDVTNDETSDGSDDDTTHMSHSLSSDDMLRDISPRELAKKLSSKPNNSSSASITPASSADFIDEHRSSSLLQSTSLIKHNDSNKISSFLSGGSRENESPSIGKSSLSPRESSKISPSHHILESIRENSTAFISPRHALSSDHSQIDEEALVEANNTMRSFLSDLNLSSADDAFEDKAQRRIVKESFAVEFCGRRKLRHLFLFNDVIVCAKYQASSKQKFTFDVKWYLNLNGVSILDLSDVSNQVKYDKEAIENQILATRTNLMLLRGQMLHLKKSKQKPPLKVIKKLKKKRTELEAELVLLLPHLPLVIKHSSGKKYTFFLSSNFDRNQWIESIKFLQSQLPASKGSSTSPSSSELQAWIQTCRKNLNPSLGTFLLRSNSDEELLYGDLCINLVGMNGVMKSGQYYFCFEVDSYGHFSQKASSSVMLIEGSDQKLNEEYVFPLDGAHTLRILLYEDLGSNSKPSVVGKAHVELSRSWILDKPVEKVILFNSNCSLVSQLSYSSSELLSMRVPHTKLCPTFGIDITQVCKKEKTNVPLLIQLCVNEVERRGMREVGIYRMSGTSTDIHRLKKAFETNPYVAELLLRDIDINSVTGFLKTYLREVPEGLFSNKLYSKFVAAFNMPQTETMERTKIMLDLFLKIPIANQHTIIYLVEHLVKVYKYENHNKMSLTNLATVLGPNILRPPTAEQSGPSSSDSFTAVVIGSMSQAGILYFFLNRKLSNLPLTELDPSEIARSASATRA